MFVNPQCRRISIVFYFDERRRFTNQLANNTYIITSLAEAESRTAQGDFGTSLLAYALKI